MKRLYLILLAIVVLSSCAPVLREDLMRSASFDVRFSDMRENPDLYKGRLYILGGIIVKTTAVKRGSLIEAIYVPVDSLGYLKGARVSSGRFLAIFPKRLLDPLFFTKGREVTIAGEFIGTRKGKIEEMEYTYPFFEVKEIYLWEETKEYYYVVPPYPYYYPYWRYDPWWIYYY